jgi:hypothetical protein
MTRLGARWETADEDVRRFARSVGIASLLSLVVYVAVLWGFGFQPFRTAFLDASFSNFYDVQAHAMLDGDLHLPEGEIDIEAFVIDGRDYMYFPPGPAIARMPLLALTDRFDGELSAPSMLIAWCTSTVLLLLLIWRVRRILRPRAALSRAEAIGYGVLVASLTAGSVVLFLASMPFVYHEAYSWAIAMALGAAYCMLGFLQRPSTRALAAAAAFTLGAVLCRTTAGWACAGGLLLIALWALVRRPEVVPRRWVGRLVLAALLPLSVGIAFNWAKFRHPYMFPLEDQVWTGVNEQRRLALEANGGDLVSPKILPATATAYLRPDGIRFTPFFPWITLPARPAGNQLGSFLDQSYRTGSITAFMPVLLLLAIWGCVTTYRPKGWAGAPTMRIPLLTMLAIPGAILFYGYIAYRYTSEVVPALALAGTIGYVDLARRLEGRPPRWRRAAFTTMGVLAVFGFVAHLAVAFYTMRINNPHELRDYARLQEELSDRLPGQPFDDLVHASAGLPATGEADDYHIVGDCDALYVGTGEPLWPWMPVQLRELGWDLDLSALPEGGPDEPIEITLATPRDYPGEGVVLHLEDGTFRGTFDTTKEILGRRARPIPEDGKLRLRLVSDLGLMQYALADIDNPERGLVDIENSLPTPDWFRQQLIFDTPFDEPATVEGVQITPVPTAPLEYCEHLRAKLASLP